MSKKKDKPKEVVKTIVEYGVQIPESALFGLIRLDAAKVLKDVDAALRIRFPLGWESNEMKNLRKVLKTVTEVVTGIQETWQYDLMDYIKKGISPADETWTKKPTPSKGKKQNPAIVFTDVEQKKIAALRKKGATIKEIAKALNRSDKKVAPAVHLYDKSVAKKK